MSNPTFSRRDLLRLGGKLVLTVGAAKVVIALPGCDDDDYTPPTADAPLGDGPRPDAYDYGGYVTLDDCHSIGTYHYRIAYPPSSTYHIYFSNAYGCPYYVAPTTNVKCYPDYPDFAPGYSYFCFSGTYYALTMP